MYYTIGQGITGTIDGRVYFFDGWFMDAARTVPYYHSGPLAVALTGDITLYAKWV